MWGMRTLIHYWCVRKLEQSLWNQCGETPKFYHMFLLSWDESHGAVPLQGIPMTTEQNGVLSPGSSLAMT